MFLIMTGVSFVVFCSSLGCDIPEGKSNDLFSSCLMFLDLHPTLFALYVFQSHAAQSMHAYLIPIARSVLLHAVSDLA